MAKKTLIANRYAEKPSAELVGLAKTFIVLKVGAEELGEVWSQRKLDIHINLILSELSNRNFFG